MKPSIISRKYVSIKDDKTLIQNEVENTMNLTRIEYNRTNEQDKQSAIGKTDGLLIEKKQDKAPNMALINFFMPIKKRYLS